MLVSNRLVVSAQLLFDSNICSGTIWLEKISRVATARVNGVTSLPCACQLSAHTFVIYKMGKVSSPLTRTSPPLYSSTSVGVNAYLFIYIFVWHGPYCKRWSKNKKEKCLDTTHRKIIVGMHTQYWLVDLHKKVFSCWTLLLYSKSNQRCMLRNLPIFRVQLGCNSWGR